MYFNKFGDKVCYSTNLGNIETRTIADKLLWFLKSAN